MTFMTAFSRRQWLGATVASSAAWALSSASTAGAAAPQERLPPAARRLATEKLLAYFKGVGPQLLRPVMGAFKHPSIAPSLPGKEYATDLWDWDTLWTARGLFQLARLSGDRAFHARVAEHVRGSLLNFFDYQSPEGRLRIVINSERPNAGIRPNQAPNHHNQAKPVFGQLILLLADETRSVEGVSPLFDNLIRFYNSWALQNETETGLLVWGDDVSIGNDNDPSTFGRPFFSSANLLLNCLYHEDLKSAMEIGRRLARPAVEMEWLAVRLRRLTAAIGRECWDSRDAFFYTVDVQSVDKRAQLIPDVPPGMAMSWSTIPLRFQTFTGFLPLWCGVASTEQAKKLVERNYLADDRLRANFGVRSLVRDEPMYSMAFSGNPSNWLGPVWIIVNYLVWKALAAYGYREAAVDLADKTIKLLASGLAKDGSLNEYYHPDSGAPLSHEGFVDWNMLVLEMF